VEGSGRRQLSTPPHDDCDGSEVLGCFDKCWTASTTEGGCDDDSIIENTGGKTIKELCPSTCPIRIAKDDCKDNTKSASHCVATCTDASYNFAAYCQNPYMTFVLDLCPKTCKVEGSGRRQLSTPPHDDCDGSEVLGCFDKCWTASTTQGGCDDDSIIENTGGKTIQELCPSTCPIRIAEDDCEGNTKSASHCVATCTAASYNFAAYCQNPHMTFVLGICPKTCKVEGTRRRELSSRLLRN